MEKVEQYLKDLKFKRRVFGGVDEEHVLICIQELCDLYQEEQKRVPNDKNWKKMKGQLQQARKELEEQKEVCAALEAEADRAKEQLRRLEQEKEKESSGAREQEITAQVQEEYARKVQELNDTMDSIQSIKKDTVVRAQVEAAQEAARLRREILAKVEEQRQEAEAEILQLQRKIGELKQRREEARKALQTEGERLSVFIDRMQAELEVMKEQSQGLGKTDPEEAPPALNPLGDILYVG